MLAALASVGIWLLVIVGEERSVAAATVEMAAKFTNLTVLLVAVVASWIAVAAPTRSSTGGAASLADDVSPRRPERRHVANVDAGHDRPSHHPDRPGRSR